MRRAVSACLAAFAILFFPLGVPDVGATNPPAAPVVGAAVCANTSTGNTALTDLGRGLYQGEQGGLYPGGSNNPPSAYRVAGINAARSVVPLDPSGRPSASGTVVFLSVGMSNTSVEFHSFIQSEVGDGQRGGSVAMVDGAQGGQPAAAWVSPTAPTWSVVNQRLAAAGYTPQQVEVIWLKQADEFPKTDFETYAHGLQNELSEITNDAAQKFPNLKQVFVSARSYGGYGPNGANPEPYAYQTGFAVKFFVAQAVANPSRRPWVGWGPYFWTDGTRGRADGLQWFCSDTFDGTHPSASGQAKIDAYMRSLFVSSVFSPWFTGSSVVAVPSPQPPASPQATNSAHASPTAASSGAQATASPGETSIPTPRGAQGSPPILKAISAISAGGFKPGWLLLVVVAGLLLVAASTFITAVLVGRRRKTRIHMPPATRSGANGNGSGGAAVDPSASGTVESGSPVGAGIPPRGPGSGRPPNT